MSPKKICLVFIALVAVFSIKAQAQVNTTLTTIKEIYAYSEIEDGDMLIVPEHPLPQCDGFWLDSATPGFMHNVSLVLSLYHTSSTLVIYGMKTNCSVVPAIHTVNC